jgi:AcrR family transcriptional regulator
MKIDPKKQTSPFNRTTQHDAKRAAILSQAARLFNSKGSRATTLKDIAESLGLTKTSLYYYVKTKEELIYQCYMATLEQHHRNLDDVEKTHSTAINRLGGFFALHFSNWQAAEENRESHLAALLEIASLQGERRAEVETQYISMFKRLRGFFRDGIASGELREFDTNSATRAVLGSVEWSFSWLRNVPREEIAEVATQATNILAHGLCAPHNTYSAPPLEAQESGAASLEGFNREAQNRLKQEAFYKTGTWFFNKKGFNGTSLDEIAEHLNVSKGAFYYHISNKEDLLYNCYWYSLDIMESIYNRAKGPQNNGLQNIDRTCRRIFLVQNSDQGPLIRYNTITSLPIKRRKKILSRTDLHNHHFGDFIRQGIKDGSVREVSTAVSVNLIAGAINASMDIKLWRRVDDLESAAIDYFDIFLNGLLPRI